MILDVRPFQETLHEGMCGPASVKIALDYFGVDKSEAELAELMGKTDLGTDEQGIVTAARSLGFDVVVKNESDFDDIQSWLDKKIPVIVDWFTRGRADYSDSAVADGHYSVVAGLDDENIYLQDPELGALRTLKREDFRKVWFDFSGEFIRPEELIIRQLIVIHPSQD
jgi:predicted double-glycine peptidase